MQIVRACAVAMASCYGICLEPSTRDVQQRMFPNVTCWHASGDHFGNFGVALGIILDTLGVPWASFWGPWASLLAAWGPGPERADPVGEKHRPFGYPFWTLGHHIFFIGPSRV